MQRLTIIAKNRPGLLADVMTLLASNDINVRDVVAEGYSDEGIVHLAVDQLDPALELLTEAGYTTVTDDVLLARIEDFPGSLALLSRRLANANIDVRALSMIQRKEGSAIVAISTNDNARVAEVLGRDLIAPGRVLID